MSKLTTQQFAEKVSLTYGRVHQLIVSGEIPAERFGKMYVIDEKYVDIINNRPERRGRKPKTLNGETTVR